MLTLRKSEDRFQGDLGWLKARHTFSFGSHYDPAFLGFRSLRVINEDRIAAGGGFPTHGHRDMEIITYILDGALEHRDNMGNGAVIRPGEVQVMSAGTGVAHSEFNHASGQTHLLQIWIEPDAPGHSPRYDQALFDPEELQDRLRLVVSPDGRDGSLWIHQDAFLYAGRLRPGTTVTQAFGPGRYGWVQVTRGTVSVNGETLAAGDGVSIAGVEALAIVGGGAETAEVLVFDLP